MAHKIEFNVKTGTHSFVSVKEPAWHKLGKVVEFAMTSAEAIEGANLGFEVVKKQNFMEHDGTYYLSPDSFSTFRTDTNRVLGSVGKDYTIVQNKDAFTFFDSIVGEGKAIFETAGALGNGEQIFITAKLPGSVVLDNIDEIKQYLLLSNSHDGSRSIEVMFTPIRVVCNNTLSMALAMAKNRIKIRHTASAHDKLKEAHKLLGIHNELMIEQEHYFNTLKEKQIGTEELVTLICNVFLTPAELQAVATAGIENMPKLADADDKQLISTRKLNMMQEVLEYYERGPGQNIVTAKGTMWGAYNAITGYYQNSKSYSDDNKKVQSNYYGANYNTMHSAYVTAVNIALDKIPVLTNKGTKFNN